VTKLTLALASTIVDKAIEKGRERRFKPLTVAVLDPGGHLVTLKREDGSGILRADIAIGKAWGPLGMGFGGREFARRATAQPSFIAALIGASGGRVVPAAGGVLIRSKEGEILGSVGISGDNSENDEICAIHGIESAGLVADPGPPAAA
jgi:uncharacterized protein GlcG (DUF336 family)